MKCQITGKNITVTDSIRFAIETKLSKMDKYFVINEDVEAKVLIRTYKDAQKIEITIFTKMMDFRVEVKDTDLYDYYTKNPFNILTLEQYGDILMACVKHLRSDIVIHRLTGDGPKKILVEPLFSANKRMVLNYINNRLRTENIVQGSEIL